MTPSQPFLVQHPPVGRMEAGAALAKAASSSGKSTGKLAVELLQAVLGPRKIQMAEYFVQGVWLETREDPATFVGSVANWRLNRSLIAKGDGDQINLMTDKHLAGLVLAASGFPVPAVKAIFATEASFGPVPTLRRAGDLADWLMEPAHLPAFAKPIGGTMSLGSVPLVSVEPGLLDIGGRKASVLPFAREVAALYPNGWMIQEQLRQPPQIEALIGPGIGTVRLVTLWEATGPQVLYSVWRHPAPGTWVDAAIHGHPNVGCALDANGTVISAQAGDLLTGHPVTHSLINPHLPLVGFTLEQWSGITAIGCAAHRLFPGHALIGWDFAMTDRGPVICEVNCNPLHMSYQRAFRRGILHAEYRARFNAARDLLARRQSGTAGP